MKICLNENNHAVRNCYKSFKTAAQKHTRLHNASSSTPSTSYSFQLQIRRNKSISTINWQSIRISINKLKGFENKYSYIDERNFIS